MNSKSSFSQAGFYAFDKEDKFSKAHWTTHVGVFLTGFAVGGAMSKYGKNPDAVFGLIRADKSSLSKHATNAAVRTLGAGLEFWSAKGYAPFSKFNQEDFEKSLTKLPKLLGYLLTTYY